MATKRTTPTKKKQSKANIIGIGRLTKEKLTFIVFIIIFGGLGSWTLLRSHADATTINVYDQAAVTAAYKSMIVNNENVTANWTGSVRTCAPGTISDAARIASVRAVNFARLLVGVQPITAPSITSTAQSNVQKAALIQEGLNISGFTSSGTPIYDTGSFTLSHNPPTSARCYTPAGGSTSGSSDLAFAYGSASSYSLQPVHAIELFLDDSDASNTAAGHRRWLLYPETTTMAFGLARDAAVAQVIGLGQNTNDGPRWTSWPSSGYFPTQLLPKNGRWSASTQNDNVTYKYATVKVTHNGVNVPVTQFPVETGYGKPTLVWKVNNFPSSTYPASGIYHVDITGIHVKGLPDAYTQSYYSIFYTP